MVLEVVGEMLKSLGYAVTTEINSVAALELFRAQPEQFSLVITDQIMVKMRGAELAGHILKIRADIPIIMITGYGSLDNKERAIQSGADDLIEKPLDLLELLNRIDVWQEVREIKNQLQRITTYAYRVRQFNNQK